tara:strand:- start:77 stop:304 length:228 start_codon:yes stop_codon:yes gene_type:complete
MTKVIFDFDMFESKEAVDQLTLSCMTHNYPEFVDKYGATNEADKAMARLFGTAWEESKEKVWQWFDTDCLAKRSE